MLRLRPDPDLAREAVGAEGKGDLLEMNALNEPGSATLLLAGGLALALRRRCH